MKNQTKGWSRVVSILMLVCLMVQSLGGTIVVAQSVERPKSKHLPQIVVPSLGGIKVNTWNGNVFYSMPLLSISGRGVPIDLTLSYNSSWFRTNSNYGYGWQLSYNIFYTAKEGGDIVVAWEDGRTEKFVFNNGAYILPADTSSVLTQYESGKFKLRTKNGLEYFFENPSHKKVTKILDQNGLSLTFQYNSESLLNKLTDSSGREVTLSYTANKLTQITDTNSSPARNIIIGYLNESLSQVTDVRGGVTKFDYNTEGFLTKITDVLNFKTSIVYSNGIVAKLHNDASENTYFSFDLTNLLTTIVYLSDFANHHIVKYHYDSAGRVKKIEKVKDNNGNTIAQQFEWDTNNNMTLFKDENLNSINYTYDSNGNLLTETDALGKVKTYTYEQTFNKVTSVKDENNRTTNYTYDSKGNLTRITDALSNQINYTYSSNGDLLTETDALNNTTVYEYNSHGYRTKITNPLSQVETTTYDSLGRILTYTNANNATLSYQYDLAGNKIKVTDALNYQSNYTYDAHNRELTHTDANSRVTRKVYNAAGKLIEEVNADNKSVIYTYDKLGNLTAVKNPSGNSIYFEYDYLGRVIKHIDELGKYKTYTYDNVGNLKTETDQNGSTLGYSYDALNRLTLLDTPDNNDVTYAYDNVGNIISEITPDVSTTRTFDQLNRVTSIQTNTNGLSKTISYTYNANNNRITMTDPDAGVTNYTYDAANRLLSIKNPKNQTTSYTYDNAGRVLRKDLASGLITSYTYDVANKITSVVNKKADQTVISNYNYTYDSVGNKISVATGSETTNYTYDNQSRLTSVGGSGAVAESFTYDESGNRLTRTAGGSTTNFQYDGSNRLIGYGSTTLSYDMNGNTVLKNQSGSSTSYSYNSRNFLTSVGLTPTQSNSYKYYADGRRLSTTDKNGVTTYFFYDGANELMETNSSGVTTSRYTSNGIDDWLSQDIGADSYFYLKDGSGSITSLTASNQAQVNSYKYDHSGNLTQQTGTTYNNHLFTGRQQDKDTGLYYNRARYYDPQTARFTQKDPSGYSDGLNLYLYARNNSINFVDPFGKFALPLVAAAGIAGAGVSALSTALVMTSRGETVTYADITGAAVGGTIDGMLTASIASKMLGTSTVVSMGGAAASGIASNFVKQMVEHRGNITKVDGNEVMSNGFATMMSSGILMWTKFLVGRNSISAIAKSETTKFLKDKGRQLTLSTGKKISASYYLTGLAQEVVSNSYSFLSEWLSQGRRLSNEAPSNLNNYTSLQSLMGSRSGSYAKLSLDSKGNQVIYIQNPNNPGEILGVGNNGASYLWHVTYFGDKNMNHPAGNDIISDEYIDKNWETGNAGPVGPDNFAVRFEKKAFFSHSGQWRFRISSDDGYRLFIDGVLKDEKWWDGSHDVGPVVEVSAGEHMVRLDYFEGTGSSRVSLRWERYFPEGVTVCRNTGYNGGCTTYSSDSNDFRLSGFYNDDAESIKVSSGWEAVLFEHTDYAGQYYKFDGDVDNMDNPSPRNGMKVGNNQASSIKVRRKNPTNFTLYDRGDFNGDSFSGDSTLPNLEHWGFNDTAESIKIASGYQAIVCEHSDFRGICGRASGGDYSDISALIYGLREPQSPWQGRASSVRMCQGVCPDEGKVPSLIIPSNGVEYVPGSVINFYWVGAEREYDIEIWGGALAQPLKRGFNSTTFWSVSDLPKSSQPYYWRVKSWNEYGESGWTAQWSFKVQDIPVDSVVIEGPTSAELNQSITLNAAVNPINATGQITYNWTPVPKSGQGTASAVYSWATLGQKSVTVSVTDQIGSKTDSHSVSVACLNKYQFEYFSNQTLSGEADYTSCAPDIDYEWDTLGPDNVSDGDLTVQSGQVFYMDNIRTHVTATANSQQNQISLYSTDQFSIGDEVLVVQMTGTNAGIYEYKYIQSIQSNNLIFKSNLTNTYTVSGNSKAQVIKVYHYKNVNIAGEVTSHIWDGFTGGIIVFKVAEQLTIQSTGKINATNLGFEGGWGGEQLSGGVIDTGSTGGSYTADLPQNGPSGGTCGGCVSPEGPVNGGGGIGGRGSRGNDAASGGGGGSYGSVGNNGSVVSVHPNQQGGITGQTYGDVQVSKLLLGSGGGGGGKGNDGFGNKGGNGGGAVLINSGSIVLNGKVEANGGDALNNGIGNAGGGGGGSGGSILIKSRSVNAQSNSATVSGGIASYGQTHLNGSRGGDGGKGRIRVEYCNTISGTVSPDASTVQSTCVRDNFSARWQGSFNFDAGNYRFTSSTDDGVRLWIDGNLVIDSWQTYAYRQLTADVNLAAGPHSIKLEYFEYINEATARLEWQTAPQTCPNTFCVSYYNNTSLTGTPVYQTTEGAINHTWASGGPGNGVNSDYFSARWQGSFVFSQGDYTFSSTTDDGVRVWVDNNMIINNWTDHGPTVDTANVNLSAGTHEVKMEYYEKIVGAVAILQWQQAGGSNLTPLVNINFEQTPGSTVSNTGSIGGNLNITGTTPTWSTNVSQNGGSRSIDFGTTAGNYVIESSSPYSQLAGLGKFTITGWVNNKNSTEGSGGNRIVSWINHGGDGVDLVYKSDGSLQIGVDQWPDNLPSRSSAGKISTDSAGSSSNWRFFAVSYDGTTNSNNLNFYFGSAQTQATLDVTKSYDRGSVGSSIANLAVGHFNSATRSIAQDRMFRGLIDEVKIYNKVLSTAEILTVQGSTAPPGGGSCQNTFCVEYFNNTTLTGTPVYTTTENTIEHAWNQFGPGNGVNNDNFSGRWVGNFTFTAGSHTFNTWSDDRVRLWIDGNMIINNWVDHGGTLDTATVNLTAGTHEVKLEYVEVGGGAEIFYEHVIN
jgi:RHS repeat-associated protein